MNDLIKTGEYTAVNKNFLSKEGAQMAANYSGTPITSDVLSASPKPYTLPSVPVSTTADAITGQSAAIVEQSRTAQALQRETEQKKAELEAKGATFKDRLLNAYTGIKDVMSSRSTLENQNKLGEKSQKVTDVTNQIEASQRAQQNELRAVDQEGTLTDAQKGAKKREINRQYAFEQADLALIQTAANRDLITAQSIVDRKVQLALEPLKFELDFTKQFYDENKADLSKEDDKLFKLKIQEDERAYDEGKTLQETIGKLQLQAASQGADPSIVSAIGKAKTVGEAAAVAGPYAGDVLDRQLKQAQLDKLNAEVKVLGVPKITNPNAGDYTQALNVILGSGTFTKDQKASVINAVNNGQDPFIVIKNQAKNIMGQTLATSLDKSETAKAQMEAIDLLLTEYYAKGGKTGVFEGNYEKTLNKLGQVDNPELVEIATNISSALQIYRNAVSGTAYSVQEGKEISSIFPGINKSEGLNQALISGRVKAFDSTIDSSYRNTLGSVYDQLKKTQSTGSPFDPLKLNTQSVQGIDPKNDPLKLSL